MGQLLKINIFKDFSFFGVLLLAFMVGCNQKEQPIEPIAIITLSESSGPSAGGETITITGAGLQYTESVLFGGVACTDISIISSDSLTCITPAHAAGVVSVLITNSAGRTSTLTSVYTFVDGPAITSVAPSSGTTAGGDTITITGTDFDSGATVLVGGSLCSSVTVVSSTSITCVTPSTSAGTVSITVTNPDEQEDVLASAFTYGAPLSVSNVSPRTGPLAGGGTATIVGSGFVAGATVTFGGVACTAPTVLSSRYITCTIPANPAGAVTVEVTNPDTTTANMATAYTYQSAPTVASVSPSVGGLSSGTMLTITGTNFTSGASVTVDGSACTSVIVVNATTITCYAPGHAAGAVNVTVTNSDSQTGTGVGVYTYQPGPTVTSASPSAGALAGGTLITITGTGFVAGATVTIDGSACAGLTVVTATTITCTIPAHAAGYTNITVTNTDSQSGTKASAYKYQAAPTVTSVSPTVGPLAGGATVTITGTGFLTGATVDLGGVACTGVTVVNSTSITCTAGANVAGAVAATVTNSDTQSGSLAAAYTYQAAPTVTSASPNEGTILGGTNITITGTDFLAGATVLIGGTACASITVVNPTTITCTTPANSSGAVTIAVTNTDSQSGSAATAFTYRDGPIISSISPTKGALAGGSTLTITGTGFVTGASVMVGAFACGAVNVVSSTSITCTLPANVASSVDVTVTNTDTQTYTLSSSYTYQPAPTIISISPTAGALAGGTTLTLTGTGFLAGATVTVDGSTCSSVRVLNSNTITCLIPNHIAATVDVVVTNNDTQIGTLAGSYTYQAAPTVTSVAPTSGSVNGATAVTVTGTGFIAGATVDFGGSSCAGVTVVTPTTITCTTSAHSAGQVTVSVTNSDTQSGNSTNAYTYRAAPTVTGITPSAGALAGGTSITVTGSGFYTGTTVDINGTPCTNVSITNSTSLTCTTPAGAAGVATVLITNADGQTGSNAAYTYQAAPTATLISPTIGATTGGTLVTITGTGFVSGATVTVGGNTCSGVTVSSATSLTCTTSSHAAGVVDVVVRNRDTQSGTLAGSFTYAAGPTVTSASPSAGALAGGTSVTISGTNFDAASTVSFDGVACAGVTTFNSSTSLTCSLTPAHAAGVVSITVTNPNTLTGSSNVYTYRAAPTITTVYPSAGAVAGGTSIQLTGTGFVSGATVTIDGSPCTAVNVLSLTSLRCSTPAHAAGAAVDVVVTNSDTQTGTLVGGYTYQDAPTVTSISPSSGSTTGGAAVTITGTGFVTAATVSIGGNQCTGVTVVNPTEITCTTAANSAGVVSVAVTNEDTQTGSASNLFTYVGAPTVTTISPSAGHTAGGTNITITGTNFISGMTVDFGGSACAGITVVSSTSLTCTTAAHAAGAVTVTATNTLGPVEKYPVF